jgi:hypothetical protein
MRFGCKKVCQLAIRKLFSKNLQRLNICCTDSGWIGYKITEYVSVHGSTGLTVKAVKIIKISPTS